jgi:hypothetical protein
MSRLICSPCDVTRAGRQRPNVVIEFRPLTVPTAAVSIWRRGAPNEVGADRDVSGHRKERQCRAGRRSYGSEWTTTGPRVPRALPAQSSRGRWSCSASDIHSHTELGGLFRTVITHSRADASTSRNLPRRGSWFVSPPDGLIELLGGPEGRRAGRSDRLDSSQACQSMPFTRAADGDRTLKPYQAPGIASNRKASMVCNSAFMARRS